MQLTKIELMIDMVIKKNLPTFSASQKFNRVDCFIFSTKKTFYVLQNAFIKVLVFYYFDLKCFICIKTNI